VELEQTTDDASPSTNKKNATAVLLCFLAVAYNIAFHYSSTLIS